TRGQSYGDDVELGAGAHVVSSTDNVTFDGNVSGRSHSLRVDAPLATTFKGEVDVESLLTDQPGTTEVSGGLVRTVHGQQYDDAVTVSGRDETIKADAFVAGTFVTFNKT